MRPDVQLRALAPGDAAELEAAFRAIGWRKPRTRFERYLAEQADDVRWVRVAESRGTPVGYVTLVWDSPDPTFRADGVPEVMDLNVLPAARRRGIGSVLLAATERAAQARAPEVGLRVGLHPGFGAAQRLYVRRGYVPDGTGVIHGRKQLAEGALVTLDDDLTLRLRKRLVGPPEESYLATLRRRVGSRLLSVPSVAVVVHDLDGALLLVRDRASGAWSLPAGAIELGESPLEAARRELREETGIQASQLSLVAGLGGNEFRYVYPNGDAVEYQIFVFGGSVDQAPGPTDEREVEQIRFFDRDEAPGLALPYPESLLWGGAS